MTHDHTDTLPGLVRTIRNANTRIADRYNADDAEVTIQDADGSDPELATVRLTWGGFATLADALTRQADVSQHLIREPAVQDLNAGVNTKGRADEGSPFAWVNAEIAIPVDPIDAVDSLEEVDVDAEDLVDELEAQECCPDPEDACDNCAGDRSKPDALYHPLDSTKMESPSETGDE